MTVEIRCLLATGVISILLESVPENRPKKSIINSTVNREKISNATLIPFAIGVYAANAMNISNGMTVFGATLFLLAMILKVTNIFLASDLIFKWQYIASVMGVASIYIPLI